MSDEEVAANKQLMAVDLQDERSRTRAGFKPAAPEDQANGQRKQAAPRKAQTEAKKDGRRPTLTAKAKAAEEAKQKAEADKEKKRAEAERAAQEAKRKAEAKEAAKLKEEADKKAKRKAEAEAKAAREAAKKAAEEDKAARKRAREEEAEKEAAHNTNLAREQERIDELAEAQRMITELEDSARERIAVLEEAALKAQRETERAYRAAEKAKRETDRIKEQSLKEAQRQYGNPYREAEPAKDQRRQLSPDPWSMESATGDNSGGGLEAPAGMSAEDKRIKKMADNIRQIHPDLADYSDEFLAVQSVAELKKMSRDTANAEAAKPGKRLENRHQANFAKARENPVTVPEGKDNRSSILHEARFLPGPAAKGVDLWTEARKIWGAQGVDAICNYDLKGLGMSGSVTAKGMEALHNPGSADISVKMFSVINAINAKAGVRTILSAGDDRFETQESWKEVSDMNELRIAFRNLRQAAFLVRPWDHSLMVLEAWFNPTFWLVDELKGFKRATLIGEFIDHILVQNALNWSQEQPYHDLGEIQTEWNAWWGVRKTCAPKEGKGGEEKSKGKNAQEGKSQKNGGRGGGNSGGSGNSGRGGGGRGGGRGGRSSAGKTIPPFIGEPSDTNICPYYNMMQGCRNDGQNCVQIRNQKPTRMFHKCNFVIKGANGQKELCKQQHPNHEH